MAQMCGYTRIYNESRRTSSLDRCNCLSQSLKEMLRSSLQRYLSLRPFVVQAIYT
jgi:hypothetical protein